MKILIISLAGIGDTLFATPLIQELKENFPNVKIDTLVMWKGSKDILENNPNINGVYHFNFIKEGILKSLIFLKKIKRERYDISINTHPQSKKEYRIISKLIGAKIRISHEYDNFSFLDRLLVNKTVKQDYSKHCIENNLNLLKLLNIKPKLRKHNYEILLRSKDKRYSDRFIKENKLSNKIIFGIHVGSGTTKNLRLRRWPLENYYELIKKILELKRNIRILLFGGPAELNENKFLIEKIKDKRVILVKTRSILETAAIIKKCNFFISVDTSLMHIAAAMKVPYQIVIRTPTFNKTVEPYRKRFILVGNKPLKDIGYRYNGKGIYGEKEKIINYMKLITPDEVFKVILRKLPKKFKNVKSKNKNLEIKKVV